MEDIINRGGGNVFISVYNSNEDGSLADTDVKVNCDGREFTVPAGTRVKLTPEVSITIYPYMYHDLHVEKGSGAVLLGEVSMSNDDSNDNRFSLSLWGVFQLLRRTKRLIDFYVRNIHSPFK